MAAVYRYIDTNDEIVKYVGIVFGKTRSLDQRIKEHERDWWYVHGVWRIEYITEAIDSRSEVEAFESHYISLFHTDVYYNTAKAGWGINKFLPDRTNDWVEYIPGAEIFDDIKLAKNRLRRLEFQYNQIKCNIRDSEQRLLSLQDRIKIVEQQTGKMVCAEEIYAALDEKADLYNKLSSGITTKRCIEKWELMRSGVMMAKAVIQELLSSA